MNVASLENCKELDCDRLVGDHGAHVAAAQRAVGIKE